MRVQLPLYKNKEIQTVLRFFTREFITHYLLIDKQD